MLIRSLIVGLVVMAAGGGFALYSAHIERERDAAELQLRKEMNDSLRLIADATVNRIRTKPTSATETSETAKLASDEKRILTDAHANFRYNCEYFTKYVSAGNAIAAEPFPDTSRLYAIAVLIRTLQAPQQQDLAAKYNDYMERFRAASPGAQKFPATMAAALDGCAGVSRGTWLAPD
jgi:hypothetical protein